MPRTARRRQVERVNYPKGVNTLHSTTVCKSHGEEVSK